jgi:uncharacterized protein
MDCKKTLSLQAKLVFNFSIKMSDEKNDYQHDDYDDMDDLVPMPPERSIWWDYGVILAAGTGGGLLTQWVMTSVAAQFGIGDISEWAAALTPATAAQYGDALRCLAAINTVGSFLLPALFFIHFFYDLWGFEYLNADRLPRMANFNSGLVWLLCAMPLVQGCYALNTYLTVKMGMPANAVADSFQVGILKMTDYKMLALNLLVVAFLPALCEEFWFRGVIQKVLGRSMRSANMGIWVTAVWFSLYHAQADGFIPRMLLGAMLGYLAYWSSSIWTSVIAHFLNNMIPVLVAFYYPEQVLQIGKASANDNINILLVLFSLAFTVAFGAFLYFINSHNRGEYEERLVLNV